MPHDNISTLLRVTYNKNERVLGEIAQAIDQEEGDLTSVSIIEEDNGKTVRDLTIHTDDEDHRDELLNKIKKLECVEVESVTDKTFDLHQGGKLEIRPKHTICDHEDLSRVYTPDVARVSKAIDKDPSRVYELTTKHNSIAIVTDSSALLGMGDVRPEAGLPVMEGKAVLFKQLAGIDAYPVCIEKDDSDGIIRTVKSLSPTFGGINLEDIASPQCFEIEKRLEEELNIPVFHDDQHGTAVVIMAGLFNALKLVGKELKDCKVIVTGIGAAGIACTKMLLHAGVDNLIGVDKDGALVKGKDYDNEMWQWYAKHTNQNEESGELSDVIEGADVFIGVSAPNILKVEDVKKMADEPIVFAMANPTPEIPPEDAEPYAKIIATGRSDYPNQINNVLCFPGLFRGILDARVKKVTMKMKMAAAKALASVIKEDELNKNYIIPDVFDDRIVPKIREAIINSAKKSEDDNQDGEDGQ